MWLVPLPNISNNDGRDIRVKNWEEKGIIEGSKYPLGLIWFGQLLLLPVIHWVWSKKKRILIFVHQINFIPFFMSEKFGLFLAYSILVADLTYPPLTSQPDVWSINRFLIKQLPLFIDQTSGWEVSGGYVKSALTCCMQERGQVFWPEKWGKINLLPYGKTKVFFCLLFLFL